jgi:signal transduction histidine kinase
VLAEAVAARDTFIAVAAHELRNPMTPIIGQVELLLAAVRAGRFSPEQVEQRLVRIQQATSQYMKRATTLLDVSRITTGKFSVEPMPFDLAALLHDVADAFADAARHARSSIRVEAPPALPVTLDRLATEQIIDNLVSNAIKYTPSGGHVLVSTRRSAHATLQVRDTGVGISADEIPRIWDRLFRGDRSRAERGLGLGLSLVKAIVEAHGGTVAVDSDPGTGSTFTISLPLS